MHELQRLLGRKTLEAEACNLFAGRSGATEAWLGSRALMGRGMVGEQSSPDMMTAPPGVEADDYCEQVHPVYRRETKPGRPVSDRDLPRNSAREHSNFDRATTTPAANQI